MSAGRLYFVCGSRNCSVSTLAESKPLSTRCSASIDCTSRPETARIAIESATSTTTRPSRVLPPVLDVRRDPVCSARDGSARDTRMAGATPQTSATITPANVVNSSTVASSATSGGIGTGRGCSHASVPSSQRPSSKPSDAAAIDSSSTSVSIWPITARRVAPSADRTAISR